MRAVRVVPSKRVRCNTRDVTELIGDPGAMMAQAAEWRAIAGRVSDAGARGAAAVEGVHFEGPAAERARASARSQRTRATGIAADLQALAAALVRDAGELAAGQRREREGEEAAEAPPEAP